MRLVQQCMHHSFIQPVYDQYGMQLLYVQVLFILLWIRYVWKSVLLELSLLSLKKHDHVSWVWNHEAWRFRVCQDSTINCQTDQCRFLQVAPHTFCSEHVTVPAAVLCCAVLCCCCCCCLPAWA